MPPKQIFLFVGNNEFQLAKLEKKAASEKNTDQAMVELNLFAADLPSTSRTDVLTNTQAAPFLTQFRYVILRKIFSAGSGGFALTSETGQKEFIETLRSISPTTIVILSDADTDLSARDCHETRKNFVQKMKEAFDGILIFDQPLLPTRPEDQAGWIEREAKKHGVAISRKAAFELLNRIELFDPRVIAGELAKLAAYIGFEGEITGRDVADIGIRVFTADIFKLTDHIGAGNKRLAIEAYHKIIMERAPEEVFPMIVRQFRLILAIKDAQRNGIPLNALSGYQDLRSDFVRGKVAEQSKKFSIEELQAIYRRLLKIDQAVKTSMIDMVTATDMLIAEIS